MPPPPQKKRSAEATDEHAAWNAEAQKILGPPEAPGELGKLGPYRVLKVLGKGGMGMVFQAHDAQLKRSIALKVMLPQFAQKAASRERFLREARAAAALEHDHIIPIYQVDEDRGVPFIAMSFLKGMNLEDYLKKKSLLLPQILRVGREIAKGLSAAHEKGLIHRDIKPANLWLDANTQGRIKILDFGLARLATEDNGLTQEGAILGTPAYMAPEQAAGKTATAASDLFSLGAVLYRLCTGQKPFKGNDTLAILYALATATPTPVLELNPEVPEPFANLVMQLLEKDPAKRPESAKKVAESIYALERARVVARLTSSPNASMNTAGASQMVSITPDESSDSFLSEEDLAPPPKKKGKRKTALPAWVWIGAGAGIVAVLALLIAVLSTGRPKMGTVAISSEAPGVNVIFESGSQQVTVDAVVSHEFSLPPGAWKVRLERPQKNLMLEPVAFQLAVLQRQTVTVKRVKTATLALPVRPPPSGKAPLAIAPFDAKKALEYQKLWADQLGLKVEETNSIGMKLRLIPPGEFLMGAGPDEMKQLAEGWTDADREPTKISTE